MNQEQLSVLSRGPEWLLTKFANLPVACILPEGTNRASKTRSPFKAGFREAWSGLWPEEFREDYGELWPGYPPSDYWELVDAFHFHWTAKTEAQKDQLFVFIRKLFTDQLRPAIQPAPRQRPLMTVDAKLGNVTLPLEMVLGLLAHHKVVRFEPRSLLDYLTIWLMTFRRQGKLAICELKGCPHPYFVKEHPRYRYCSQGCGDEARKGRKSRWWRKNRGRGK